MKLIFCKLWFCTKKSVDCKFLELSTCPVAVDQICNLDAKKWTVWRQQVYKLKTNPNSATCLLLTNFCRPFLLIFSYLLSHKLHFLFCFYFLSSRFLFCFWFQATLFNNQLELDLLSLFFSSTASSYFAYFFVCLHTANCSLFHHL